MDLPLPQRIGLAALCASCLAPAPGKMAALFGPGATRLALRAAAPPLLAGEPVVAVDGGNRFDPYETVRAERALGGSGRIALSRLLVSRAFTCHQMEALLSRDLPGALARFRARTALVLGLPELFADGDVPYAEACRVFRRCLSSLQRLSRKGTRVVLAGEADGVRPFGRAAGLAGRLPGAPAGPGREGFLRRLAREADPLLLLGKR